MLTTKYLTSEQFKQFLPEVSLDKFTVFQEPSWYFLLEEFVFNIKGDMNCKYLTVLDNDQLILLLPVIEKAKPRVFQPKSLKSNSNYYSTYFGIICFDEHKKREALESMAKYLKQEAFDKLELNPVVKGSVDNNDITYLLRSAGFYVHDFFLYGNWIKITSDSFNDYYASLSSQLKNTIKRKEKKLSKDYPSYEIKLHINNNLELDNAIDDYEHIYTKSWKGDEPYTLFIRNLIKHHASQGTLRFALLYIDKEPAAAQIWFVKNGCASIFKLAYDPTYASYSVGSILSKYLFELALDNDKVNLIDYLTGDDSYKKDWMEVRREVIGIVAYNKKTFLGILLILMKKTKILGKPFAQYFRNLVSRQ